MGFVWQLAVIQLEHSTVISGVALEGVPYHFEKNISPLKNLFALLKGYRIPVSNEVNLEVEIQGVKHSLKTNYKGDFNLILEELVTEIPKIYRKGETQPMEILQDYPVIFEKSESKFDVISDLDDTILVSHTANFFKRVATLAFVQPNKRRVINFSYQLYKFFDARGARFYYISKSESNLFKIISVIISKYDLPKGVLFLTSYLNLRQLFRPKKGKDFKINRIASILERTGDKKFIFVGDDSQRDMEIYADAVALFPNRILKIYIHRTHKNSSHRQKKQLEELMQSDIPVLYFGRNDDVFSEFEAIKTDLL